MSFLQDFYLSALPKEGIVKDGIYFIKGYWDSTFKIFVRNEANTRWKKLGETSDITNIAGKVGKYAFTLDEGESTVTVTNVSGHTLEGALDIVYELVNKGEIDCSSNPNYPAAEMGDYYEVSGTGKIGGASGDEVTVGEFIICIADTAGGTKAVAGAAFEISETDPSE